MAAGRSQAAVQRGGQTQLQHGSGGKGGDGGGGGGGGGERGKGGVRIRDER